MNEISPQATSEQLDGKAIIASSEQANASERLHEDVLTHLTKSTVKAVSNSLGLDLSDTTSSSTATWVVRAAKSVPLFIPAGRGMRAALTYGSAAGLYAASEMKWGDNAENMGKDAVLGGFKGIAMKGSMDLIGAKMHQAGLDKKLWAAPAQGVAFGITGTATETALTRSTYYDETGKYRGIGYGLAKTGEATANLENLAIGAATFTLGAGSMKLLQGSGAAKAFPELIGNRIFQNSFTGFSFGAFSGMSEEARKQVKEGKFSAWELNKFDYAKIGKEGLFAATADAAGAAVGAKIGLPHASAEQTNSQDSITQRETRRESQNQPSAVERFRPITSAEPIRLGEPLATVQSVERIDKPSGQVIRDQAHINQIVEAPLRTAVSELWAKNIETTGSGVFHQTERKWSPFGSVLHLGEYQAPYLKMKAAEGGRYTTAEGESYQNLDNAPTAEKPKAYIVLNEHSMSPENKIIARKLGLLRMDEKIEIHVPVEPGTPAKQVEEAMQALARQFQPQPMTWGFKTPLQYFRETTNSETGVPSREWLAERTNSKEFKEQGMVYDAEHNLIFPSKELADKFNAAPPPEPTWYRGPEILGGRGGWRQAYTQAAIHLYTPEAHGFERPSPKTARVQDRNFEVSELLKPENADYYLSSKERFFELFGTKAYDTFADRHWLDLRNKAFESVEKHWPSASIEKDRALALGTIMLARSTEGHGHFTHNDLWMVNLFVPEHLWRTPDGRKLSPPEVIDLSNKVYDDMDIARRTPFDHTFAKQLIDRMNAPEGDNAYDRTQFVTVKKRSLQSIVENGLDMKVHPKYVPLLKEILHKQSEGLVPERFDKTTGADGLDNYTPVYRRGTTEERSVPLSELVKNLKIVDYGFKSSAGPILGKVSLASHDVHDHARIFWLLDKEGFFDGSKGGPDYSALMGKLSDPKQSNIFRREGELIASIAYDWRNYYDLHPSYDPQMNLKEVRDYFLHADRQGVPMSENQLRALSYIEEKLSADPSGTSPEAKRLRHIIGGVWQEVLEQKRKTDSSLWQRADGTYQRMSATNPEYLAFVIDATRVLEANSHSLWLALNHNNVKLESYLRGVADSQGDQLPATLKFNSDEVKFPHPLDAPSDLPVDTRSWIAAHPGFNTRRAPIRNWVTGQQSEYDAAEMAVATWRQQEENRAWIREMLYRDRFDLD